MARRFTNPSSKQARRNWIAGKARRTVDRRLTGKGFQLLDHSYNGRLRVDVNGRVGLAQPQEAE